MQSYQTVWTTLPFHWRQKLARTTQHGVLPRRWIEGGLRDRAPWHRAVRSSLVCREEHLDLPDQRTRIVVWYH